MELTRRQILGGAAATALALGGRRTADAAESVLVYDTATWPFYPEVVNPAFTQKTGVGVDYKKNSFFGFHDALATELVSGNTQIDVTYTFGAWTREFERYLLPLEEAGGKDAVARVRDEHFAYAVDAVSASGIVYGVPRLEFVMLCFWHADLLKQAGFDGEKGPRDYKEFLTMVQALKKGRQYGFANQWKSGAISRQYLIWLHLNGGTLYDRDGYLITDSPAGIAAAQDMVDLAGSGAMHPQSLQTTSFVDINRVFAQGEAAIVFNFQGAYQYATDPKTSAMPGDVRVGIIPPKATSGSVDAADGYAILKSSKRRRLAHDWVTFALSPEMQKAHFLKHGTFPSIKSVYRDPEVQKSVHGPVIPVMMEQLKYDVRRYNRPAYQAIFNVMDAELTLAVTKQKSAAEAMKAIAQQTRSVVDEEKPRWRPGA